MIVGRDGQQRLWDLAERCLPVDERGFAESGTGTPGVEAICSRAVWPRRADRMGVRRPAVGWERRAGTLMREGVAIPATRRRPERDVVRPRRRAGPFVPSTNRARLAVRRPGLRPRPPRRLFDFRFRLEIYVPKAKREFGYFVLPILHGDRLIGRIDPAFDHATGILHVNGVCAEPEAPPTPARVRAHDRGVGALARGGRHPFTRRVPAAWRART